MARLPGDLAENVARFALRLPGDLPWLVAACALAARGAEAADGLSTVVGDAVGRGHDAERMREALLQTLLFAGYPCALNALTVWRRTLAESAPGQLAAACQTPLEPVGDDPAGQAMTWLARGTENARAVYGRNFERLMANASALSPDLAGWMITEGYGRVLGRPNLPFDVRELCIVATLIPQGVPRQLFSHIKGCLNIGVGAATVEAVVELSATLVPEALAEAARNTLCTVLDS